MKEHPLIFTGESIRGIQADRKSQTRRLLKPQPPRGYELVGRVTGSTSPKNVRRFLFEDPSHSELPEFYTKRLPEVGDRIWAKESHAISRQGPDEYDIIHYAADGMAAETDRQHISPLFRPDVAFDGQWRSPLFMPRWAARHTLEVLDVRVERLQDISEEDAKAEGIDHDASIPAMVNGEPGNVRCFGPDAATKAFSLLWDAINKKRAPWSSNPWVVAFTFRRVES